MREPSVRIAALSPAKRALLARRLAAVAHDEPAIAVRPRAPGVVTFRTSFAQERLWFLEQLVPGTAVYNVTGAFRFEGRLDVPAFRRAVAAVVTRHESLRTTFVAIAGRPIQVVSPGAPVSVKTFDAVPGPPATRESAARAALTRDTAQPFDVAHGPLVRVRIHPVADDVRLVSLTVHHLVADAWSVGILLRELASFYRVFLDGDLPSLEPPAVQYGDYAEWQRERCDGARAAALVAYWRDRLAGAPYVRLSPRRHPSFRGAGVTREVPMAIVSALREFARREGVTVFTAALAEWMALLARRLGHGDVTVVSPVANRDRLALVDVVGFFVNLVALRVDLRGDPSFRAAVRRTDSVVRGALRHQDLPFERVVGALGVERSATEPPLSAIGFALEHAVAPMIDLPGVAVTALPIAATTSKTELVLILRERASGAVTATMEYDRELHDEDGVTGLLEGFLAGLARALAHPDERLSALVPESRSGGGAVDRAQITVWARFIAQAARTPQAIALRAGDVRWTYAELAARAASVAGGLADRGVGRGAIVAVWGARDPHWIAAMLALWRRGAVYLPLEPRWPAARIADVVRRSGACLVLAGPDSCVPASVLPADVPCLEIAGGAASAEADALAAEAGPDVAPDDPAYVVYTSGSTGAPKGCIVEHAGLLNHLHAKIGLLQLGDADRVAQTASAGFDISLWQCFAPLLVGGRVELCGDDVVRDPAALRRAVAAAGVTILELVPVLLEAFLEADDAVAGGGEAAISLRWILATGEALPPALCRRWLARHPEVPLVNAYGPTECADDVTHHVIATPPPLPATRVPIGRPIAGMAVHVLNERLEPVPAGEAGELCIGGVGVGRGYLHQPELTARAFVVPDPYDGRPGSRLYRTGDRGRQAADGSFEWLGRRDAQVKIRGVRVELEEIEAVLATHPAIRAAAVVARPTDGPTHLRAWVVVGPEPPPVEELRVYAAGRLPDAMVPASFVCVPHLPFTANGKVDRDALSAAPAEAMASCASAPPLVAARRPATATERVLAALWRDVLGVETPAIDASFFALGGDSLSAIRLVAAARRHGLVLTPQQVFAHPTLAALAAVASTATELAVDQGLVVGDVPPTPIQRMLLTADLPDLHHYNMTTLLALDDAPSPTALAAAVEHLVRHHDVLRLRLVRDGAATRFTIAGLDGIVPYAHRDLSTVPDTDLASAITSAAAEAQTALDLVDGPILRVVSFDLGLGRGGRVLLTVHHVACDAASWPILIEDLATVYEQMRQGEPIVLPPKTTSYQEWARRLEAHERAPERARDRAFWRRECADAGVRLPRTGTGAPAIADVARHSHALSPGESETLARAAGAVGISVESVILAALVLALTESAEDEAVLVYLERQGREPLFSDVDVSRTVGWFTALFPVALRVAPGRDPGATLSRVAAHLGEIPDGGVAWGALAYPRDDVPDGGVGVRGSLLPEVSVNFLGRVDPPATSGWRLARESAGCEHGRRGRRPTLLDVVARIENARLEIDWYYDSVLLVEATVTAYLARFGRSLRALLSVVAETARAARRDGGAQ